MLTNCKNCGAPLNDGKCRYCGCEYGYLNSGEEKILTNAKIIYQSNIMTPNEIRTLYGYHVEYGHGKFEREK